VPPVDVEDVSLAKFMFESFIRETSDGVRRAAAMFKQPAPEMPTWNKLHPNDREAWKRIAATVRNHIKLTDANSNAVAVAELD
jgi:hypothetical protein